MTMTFYPIPKRPLEFLKACPVYAQTPIIELPANASVQIIAKDETNRMQLGAFKALGGVYAVAALIAEAYERENGRKITPDRFLTDSFQATAKEMTFVCASAGNHGMSVAAGAKIFGAKSRIHLAKSVPESFADRLREKGAEVIWSGDIYEESMAASVKDSEDTEALLLSDGSWDGYTYPPSLVMEGYTVMAEEMREHFEKNDGWPDYVFLQAGVGGLAAAIAHMIRENWSKQPEIIVVEPTAAPCLAESVKRGEMVEVKGPVSEMGRLDCKIPSLIAFESLQKTADHYVAITDEEALTGINYAKAEGIGTTHSGAAGLGAILASSRLGITLTHGSTALVILSEGTV